MYIDPHLSQQIAELGIRLGEAAVRNTAVVISERVTRAKTKKLERETINELEQIINDLTADKNELLRIGQAYEQELVAQKISDEQIEYITTKFIPLLKNLIQEIPINQNSQTTASIEKNLDILTRLLSKETLTVLQVLGFNYKQAIGEPLTQLLRAFIASVAPADPQSSSGHDQLLVSFNIELLKVAQDEDATERWERLKSN